MTEKEMEQAAAESIESFAKLVSEWGKEHSVTIPDWWDSVDMANYSQLAVRESGDMTFEQFQDALRWKHPEHFK